ncbi:LysR family transcriptional regulator [Advenella sp. WQ 585]|uniref:LysR family transcriptional regulator n=1 Tax=Advenella mandrilli TaxID=2800330 RepID=A0ABS1EHY4_9BURK|nr:LysR family transcriptional regulator [Advenella mandrilli]MBK1782652.1 LysR family transcriptional regulator [Advenella mandrilli]
MNDRQIRHFIVLSELLNFRQAAEKLNIVQPALSSSIKRLEAELGVTLFERTTREIKLTVAGQNILVDFRKILKILEAVRQKAQSTQEGFFDNLSVGFVGSASYSLLSSGVSTFRKQYPNINLSLQESTGKKIFSLIEDELIDIGIVRIPTVYNPGITVKPLKDENFVLVVPTHSEWDPGNKVSKVALEDFSKAPFVNFAFKEAPMLHLAVINICKEAGFIPQIVQEAIQMQTIITLVESGMGVGLVPAACMVHKPARAKFLHLKKITPSCKTSLALAYNENNKSLTSMRFIDTMLKVVKQQ